MIKKIVRRSRMACMVIAKDIKGYVPTKLEFWEEAKKSAYIAWTIELILCVIIQVLFGRIGQIVGALIGAYFLSNHIFGMVGMNTIIEEIETGEFKADEY